MRALATIVVAIAIAGCARADADKSAGEADPVAVKQFVAFLDHVLATTQADTADCKKLATDVSAIMTANRAVLDAAHRSAVAHRKLPADAEQHIAETFKKLFRAVGSCKDNADVHAAFAPLLARQ